MSTETQRAQFEAVMREIGAVTVGYDFPRNHNGSYEHQNCNYSLKLWQAAQASQAAEIEALKADIATYVRVASEQATEIEALRKDAERYRWLRHGDNDDLVIQHGPVAANFV